VGFLRVEDEEAKRTNEIKTTIPLLDAIDITGKDITADALLTQRDIARYLGKRHAHYHFTVTANQPTLLADIEFHFADRKEPDFDDTCSNHGRIETRRIWSTTELNGYLDFPTSDRRL
jgi:predicted transposase YbfD/YdcC